MSLKLERQIEKLIKDRAKDRALIDELVLFKDWVRREMRDGMTNLATVTVRKILEQGIEAHIVEPTTDEKLEELMK